MGMFDDLLAPATGADGAPAERRGLFDDIVAPKFTIDFAQPVEKVRAEVAKLPKWQQQDALKAWARSYVAKERDDPTTAVSNIGRTFARGSFVGPFLDEINAAGSQVAHTLTGGYFGAPYDEAIAYQRERDRDVDTRYPLLSTVGKVAGGVAGGVGAIRAAGTALAPLGAAVGGPMPAAAAETVGGRIAQGTGLGAAYGAVHGAGEATGGPEARLEGALWGAPAGALTGGLLTSGAETARGIYRAASAVRNPDRGAYQQVVKSLGDDTVDQYASRVATGAGNRNADIQTRTITILGEEMERAGGNVLRAEAATIARLQAEAGVAPSTARDQIRRLTETNRDNPLFFGEQPMVIGREARDATPGSLSQPRTAATPATGDVGYRTAARRTTPTPEEIKAAGVVENHPMAGLSDYIANSGNTTSNMAMRNAVEMRHRNQGEAFRETLVRLAPNQRTAEEAEALLGQMRQVMSQEYRAAHTGPVDYNYTVRVLPQVLDANLNRMAGRSGEPAQTLRRAIDEFYITAADGTRTSMQTLQQMQDARGTVRGMIEEARRKGRNDLAGVLQPLYDDVTRVMERASPAWRDVNRRWADGRIQERALELGENLTLSGSAAQRQALREFEHLAPLAQEQVAVGFVQKLVNKVENLRDTNDISKFFQNDAMRRLVRTVLGNDAALRLERAVRDQNVMARSMGNLANSRTGNRLATKEQMETDTGLLSAAENLSVSAIKSFMVKALQAIYQERVNRHLTRILTTPMRDTAQVSRHLQRMRTEEARMARQAQPGTVPMVGSGVLGGVAGGALASLATGDR